MFNIIKKQLQQYLTDIDDIETMAIMNVKDDNQTEMELQILHNQLKDISYQIEKIRRYVD